MLMYKIALTTFLLYASITFSLPIPMPMPTGGLKQIPFRKMTPTSTSSGSSSGASIFIPTHEREKQNKISAGGRNRILSARDPLTKGFAIPECSEFLKDGKIELENVSYDVRVLPLLRRYSLTSYQTPDGNDETNN